MNKNESAILILKKLIDLINEEVDNLDKSLAEKISISHMVAVNFLLNVILSNCEQIGADVTDMFEASMKDLMNGIKFISSGSNKLDS